jgi:hypothetical protein
VSFDYSEDHEFLKAVFNELYSPGKRLYIKEVLDPPLEENLHHEEINKYLQQKHRMGPEACQGQTDKKFPKRIHPIPILKGFHDIPSCFMSI